MYACANYIYKLTWRTDAQIYGLINLHIFSKRIMLEVLNKWSYFNVLGLKNKNLVKIAFFQNLMLYIFITILWTLTGQ
jgi:hypothetical protein